VDHRVQVCVHVCVGIFDGDQSLTVMAASRVCVCVYVSWPCLQHTRPHSRGSQGLGSGVCACVCMCV